MDEITDNSHTIISGVTSLEEKGYNYNLNPNGVTSATPDNSADDGNGLRRKPGHNLIDKLGSLGTIIGAVLAIAGVIWFFVSLINTQENIKREIITINNTVSNQNNSITRLSDKIDNLKDNYNSDLKILLNRIFDKIEFNNGKK